jgi:uncharacterized phage-associated protein
MYMARKTRGSEVSSAIHTCVACASRKGHNKQSTTAMDALTIADYFIWKSQQEGIPVTNKKLQKLLYYAQAWSLVLQNKPLFKQEIEAWVHGPAIRDVYFTFKEFGFSPIKKEVDLANLKLSGEDTKLLDEIWRVYGKFDATYLETLSHSEKPWQEARAGLDGDTPSENIIAPATMRDFYSGLLKKSQGAKA